MKPVDYRPALDEAIARSLSWLDRADDRPVGPPVIVCRSFNNNLH